MGIVKKNDPKLGSFASSDSEDCLHIPQSSEDEGSTSSEKIPAAAIPSKRRRHREYPRPMSFAGNRRILGKKRHRRFENTYQLEALNGEENLDVITIHDFISNTCSVFTRVLQDNSASQVWESFVTCSEEVQHEIIGHRDNSSRKKDLDLSVPRSPEESFRNIKVGLRNTLKKAHIPLGILENLERKIIEFFTNSPAEIFISGLLSSFERLLLHAVAQYYSLKSLSFCSESQCARLVRVSNPCKIFYQPSLPLFEYLIQRRKRSYKGIMID